MVLSPPYNEQKQSYNHTREPYMNHCGMQEKNWSGWLVVFISACFYAYQYILRVSPNMMTDELMEVFSMDATELGFFSSSFYLAYALALLPLGAVMDRWGPKYLLVAAALCCALGCELFALTSMPWVAGMGRFLIGLGAANGFLGTLKLGTLWLPAKSFSKVIALTMALGTLGAVLGGSPFEEFLNQFGWKTTLHVLAGIGIIISLALFLFIGTNPPRATTRPQGSVIHSLQEVIRAPQVWIASFYGMFMYIPIILFGDLWGVSYLERLYGVEESRAAQMIASLFFGMALGSPVFALISDILQKRTLPMTISAVVCSLFYGLILYQDDLAPLTMHICFFIAGFFYGGKSLGFASVVESLPHHLSGIAVGFSNMVIMTAGIFTLPLVGYLLDYHHGDHELSYTVGDFRFALCLIPIGLLISVLLSLWIKETYPKDSQNP